MVELVKPEIFMLAETRLTDDVEPFLAHLGAQGWNTDEKSDAGKLTEIAGKLCYNSFDPKLNKNLTRVRRNKNEDYIQNGIIKVNHGSVLEHASVTFGLCNVSRIFTHELVRHRAGTAFSQTSGRYVREEALRAYDTDFFDPEERELFIKSLESIEILYQNLEDKAFKNLSDVGLGYFHNKKQATSALRRILPNGQTNNIIFTANHRALRHICKVRTHKSAEEEIVYVFEIILGLLKLHYPNIYKDM